MKLLLRPSAAVMVLSLGLVFGSAGAMAQHPGVSCVTPALDTLRTRVQGTSAKDVSDCRANFTDCRFAIAQGSLDPTGLPADLLYVHSAVRICYTRKYSFHGGSDNYKYEGHITKIYIFGHEGALDKESCVMTDILSTIEQGQHKYFFDVNCIKK